MVRYDGEPLIAERSGGQPVIFRARGMRGTLGAPTNSVQGDNIRTDIAVARANNNIQDIGRATFGVGPVTATVAAGDWWLDLTDAAGVMQRRVTVAGGTALTTIAGPLTLGGGLTANGQVIAPGGSLVGPAYAFAGDTDTGLWREMTGSSISSPIRSVAC